MKEDNVIRSSMTVSGLLCVLLISATVQAGQLAIFPVVSIELSKDNINMLEDALATASADLFALRVLGAAEVRELLPPNQERQAAACDNVFCWSRFGTAVEATHVLAITATPADQAVLLSLKWIDVAQKRIDVRYQQPIKNDILTYLNDVKVVLAQIRDKVPGELKGSGKAPKETATIDPGPSKSAPSKPASTQSASASTTPAPTSTQPAAKSEPGYMAMSHETVDDATASAHALERTTGVKVTRVQPDGPAGAAGIKSGDILLKVNGMVIGSFDDLKRITGKMNAGRKAVFTVWRQRKEETITVTLGEKPKK